MSKFIGLIVVLALTGAVVRGQESAGGEPAAAAEPYSYGYETDSHSAAEQRDPSGKVTGYYTITDADGRSRRVEYAADESGFRAKVATNEVGTKSENSADVEVQASPPTEAQYSSYSQSQQVSGGGAVAAAPAVVSGAYNQQVRYASAVAQPASAGYSSSSYYQQQQQLKPGQVGYSVVSAAPVPVAGAGSGYSSSSYYQQQQQVKPGQVGYSEVSAAPVPVAGAGSGYSSSSYYQQQQQVRPGQVGYSSSQYGYQPGYVYANAPANQVGYAQYGYNSPGYVSGYVSGTPVAYNSAQYSSYNNHLPSQYYRAQAQQPNGVVGYASQAGQIQPAVGGAFSKYGSSSYRSSSYSSNSGSAPVGAAVSTTSSRTVTSGNPVGSSNYIVLQK